MQNSENDNAPSRLTSDNSHIFDNSFKGNFDFSKNDLASVPLIKEKHLFY